MPAPTEITATELFRLIGIPGAPLVIDVRNEEDYASDPRLIPGSVRRDWAKVAEWGEEFRGRQIVACCHHGAKLSQGVAAWLRHDGIEAESLAGGFVAWTEAKLPLLQADKIPPRGVRGSTVWVTRARPKIDRIACPWLIRRFIDPTAVFLFVTPAEVQGVADRFGATPFDIENTLWSHRGETCTFDTLLDEIGPDTPVLRRLATIVRGADTARLDLAPESAGLLAVSLGFSRMHKDDLTQLEAAMAIYDGFYRWCRDARDETHNWPAAKRAP